MILEALCNVISPPETPYDTGETEAWQEIEEKIGCALPSDYKAYIHRFGTGCIGKFVWVFNPFTDNANLNLLHQITVQLDVLHTLEEQFDVACPYPLYPQPGGLLPWGITDNGDVLFWRTIGNPDQWIIVIHEPRGPEYEEHPGGVVDFLTDLVLGNSDSTIIPFELIDQKAPFVPAK